MSKNCHHSDIFHGTSIRNYSTKPKLLIILFFVFSTLSVSTKISAQHINIQLKNVSIETALKAVEAKDGFRFVYMPETLPKNHLVGVSAKNATVEYVLNKILDNTSLTYEMVNDNLIAIAASDTKSNIIISGKVTDAEGNPLEGVSVVEKGLKKGTMSNKDGSYSLSVASQNAILVFSFIGYETKEIQILGKSVIDIKLIQIVQNLENVVVVGYGQQKKESVVGSIVQVTGQDLQRTGGVTNLALALTGQLPGVTVVQGSGEPGADDPTIFIRGMGTWNKSQPLILVDGVERRMNDIDMSEVENVSVLKDASATAVFGVKGAQGVILITTKRGKLGKPVVSMDANLSTKTVTRVTEKLNSFDQFGLRNEAIEYQLNRSSNQNWDTYLPERIRQYYKQPQANGLQYIFPDVDWKDALLKQFPLSYRANVNVSGGSDFARYFGSLSYTFDDDLLKSDADPLKRGYKAQNSYDRVNFRTNLDLNVTNSTVFSVNLAGFVSNKRNGSNTDQVLAAFYSASPDIYPLLSYDGSYGYDPKLTNNPNPFMRANNGGVTSNRVTSVTTDFSLKQKLDFITKGLSAGLRFSYDNNFSTTSSISDGGQVRSLYLDPSMIDAIYSVNGSYLDENGNYYVKDGYRIEDYMSGYLFNQANNDDYDWSRGTPVYNAESSNQDVFRKIFYQAQINYNRSFKKHEVGGLALLNREQTATGSMFPRYREDWVGRVTYGYAHRYLFESNFAYNGSEKFASDYRFGFFPSVAVGWVLTQEKFMQNINWLNRLKLRYSIGKIGNDAFDSPRWAYQTNWVRDEDRTIFGYPNRATSPNVQYYESVVGSPDLHWETAMKQNLGIEISALRNRVSASLDLFTDHRTDIFMSAGSRTIPRYFGQNAVVGNIGETKVKGYELEINLKNNFGRYLNAFLTISHTGARDKILYMEDPPLLPDYQKREGYQINQVRTQIDAGYTNNWDEVYSSTGFATGNIERMPGEYRIVDFNGDGVINAADAAPNAYPQDRPQHTYGFILGGEYKGISLQFQFYGVYNVTRQYSWQIHPFGNLALTGPALKTFAENSWTPDNMNAKYRSVVVNQQATQSLGRFAYEDGSSFRLKTAEIGYSLNKSITKYLGLNSIRFFLNGNNLFLWTKMVDDREGGFDAGGMYPLVKRFNFGINVKF